MILVQIDVINGVRFSRCFFAGAGIGLARNFSDEEFYIPIYFNAKGYFPVANNLDLMAGMDVGTKIDYAYENSKLKTNQTGSQKSGRYSPW